VHHEEFHSVVAAGLEHAIGIVQAERHRLFHHDRAAILCELQDVATVSAARRQNTEDINLVLHFLHHLGDAGEGWRTVLFRELLCSHGVEIDEGADLGVFEILVQDVRMLAGDIPAPHQGEFHFAHDLSAPEDCRQ
jgi:hypothetical protein